MKIVRLIVVLIWSVLWLVSCVFSKGRKNYTIQKIYRTGEAVAVADLIQKYEKEHQKLYNEEINDGYYLEWPALDNKNLSTYCKDYLQQAIFRKLIDFITGVKITKFLHYKKENTSIVSLVVIVQCMVMNKYPYNYNITRAAEPNCVYALKSTKVEKHNIFTIINKYCEFENDLFGKRCLKRKQVLMVGSIHYKTRQPIAKDEYLLEYEMEHQELFKKVGVNGKRIDWPHAMVHTNLDSFCYQYLGECVPSRKRRNVTGKLKIQVLNYQKLNTHMFNNVTSVTCHSNDASHLQYHMTRAPETNCVYALLRQSRGRHQIFVIIFKHCHFEESNDQHNISQDYDIQDKDVIIKTEAKKEGGGISETVQFLPMD